MGTINSDEHDAQHGVRSEREQPLAQDNATSQGRHHLNNTPRKKARESL